MSFFASILSKLGLGSSAAAAAPAPAPEAAVPAVAEAAAAPAAPEATAISVVDVVGNLEALAANHAEKLNWQTSIVDLLKPLDLDSSLATRKDLSTELGCPADKVADFAQMNMWLHKTVLQELADKGGNTPADLLN